MDKDFDYLMTTAFKNLVITTNGGEFEVERVFGSPGKEFPQKGVLMEVSLAYPSQKESAELTKGGIVLVKLKKKGESNQPLELQLTYQDRLGKEFVQNQSFSFSSVPSDKDFWQGKAVRKGVLLVRYVNLMKNLLRDEKSYFQACKSSSSDVSFQCSISKKTGITAPIPLPKEETELEEAPPMTELDPSYKNIFKDFQKYFSFEAKELDDSTLNNELKLIEDLLSCQNKKEQLVKSATRPSLGIDLQAHQDLVRTQVKALESTFKPSSESIPNSADVCFLMDCTGSMGSWINLCKDKVEEIVDLITATYSSSTKLRLSFVGYRDIRDTPRFSIQPFTDNVKELKEFIQREATASGGGDFPEDIAGGLQKTLELDW